MFEVLRDLMKEDLEKAEAAAFARGYDRGYTCGYARGYARGYAHGYACGYAHGYACGYAHGYACGAIKAYARFGNSPSEIVELVMADCGLSRDAAERYVEETLGLQPV